MYVKVHATPGAKKEGIVRDNDTMLVIAVREPAERNLANRRIRELVAETYEVPVSAVRLIAGHRSGGKVFDVDLPT